MVWVDRVTVYWGHWNFTAYAGGNLAEAVAHRFPEDEAAFEIRFVEDLLARSGEDAALLALLGHLYTESGRYRDGLSVDLRLVTLRPKDATAHYNLACSYSLLGEPSRALASLKRSIALGYRDFDHMQADPDLENARADPRWPDVVNVLNG